ncbi:MAG: carbonic anhydrase [Bryobacteraceae bacterium]|nr:carbonic anhydrase [Bryobacteraceae bacterium]
MMKLIAGYRRFRSEVFPEQKSHFKLLESSQSPDTLFITCADSRVVPSLITQTEPGELFICRVVGNLVPAHGSMMGGVSAAVEYAVSVLGVKHVIICGHSDCGAMRAFMHPEKLEPLRAVRGWLEHASAAITVAKENFAHLEGDVFLEALTKENILVQLQHLRTHPCVASGLRKGTLQIHGWYYDIGTGEVSRCDEDQHKFIALDAEFQREAEAVLA